MTRFALLCSLLCSAGPALAQGTGSLAGTITDNFGRPRPLAGAEVWVAGTPLRAMSDDDGRFRLDSVPAGTHRVTFFHPLLDSLGVQAPVTSVAVRGGAESRLELATPSGLAVFARACGRSPEEREGAAFGVVLDAERSQPVAGVRVAVTWVELDAVSSRAGRQRADISRRVARTTTDSAGQFVICGIPNSVALEIQAGKGDAESGVLPLSLAQRPFAAVQLFLGTRRPETVAAAPPVSPSPTPAPAAPAAPAGDSAAVARAAPPRIADGGAALVGRVLTPTGTALAGAIVSIEGFGAETRTDSAGRFRLVALPAGSQPLSVRAIGFSPVVRTVVLRPARTDTVEIALARNVATLPTVNVTGRIRDMNRLRGFEERRRQGFGSFLDEEAIARRSGTSAVFDLIRDQNGFVVRRDPGRNMDLVFAYRRGMPCMVDVFVDGMYARQVDGGIAGLVVPSEIRAIELYRGMNTPAQFQRAMPPCGAIVIWTRAARGA